MASTRVDHPIRGLGLIAMTAAGTAAFSSATLSTTDSTYTQAGPTAGGIGAPAAPTGSSAPVRAEIEGTGDQDAAVVVEVLQGGNPGLGRGLRGGWRLASESTTQTRGWQPPNIITGCWSPEYSTTAMDSLDAVTLRNGKIALLYHNTSTNALNITLWDPTTAAFTAGTSPVSTCSDGAACLAVDANGFLYILCEQLISSSPVWSLFRSQSADTTADGWDEIARDPFDSDPTPITDKIRMNFMGSSSDIVVTAWFRDAASGTIRQWASADAGSTFTVVNSTANLSASTLGDQVITPAGRLGVIRVTAANVANWHSVVSPWASVLSATAVQVATSVREAWLTVDPNGRIYAWTTSSATTDEVTIRYSDDEGATWTAMPAFLFDFNGDAGQFITGGRAVFAMGDAFLFHQSSDNVATYDTSPILTRCGGWSNALLYYGGDPDYYPPGGSSGNAQATWFPVSEPDDLACWTSTGTGGDGADVFTTDGRLQITTTAQTRIHTATTAPTNGATALTIAFAHYRVTSGGNQSTGVCSFEARSSDGANATLMAIRASTTGFQLWDNATGSIATITVSMLTDMQFLLICTSAGTNCALLYRRPYETAWTLGYDGTVGRTAIATGLFRWGALAATAGTHVSEWSACWHVSYTAMPFGGIGPLVSRLLTGGTRSFIGPMGKPLTGLAAPLGVGSQGTSGSRLLSVRAKDGPGVLGETFTITPRYAFPISAIFPTESPSPRATWRSTSTAENAIAFELDPTYTTSLTRSIHLTLLNVNFPTAYLEAHNGATWDTVGTWSGVIGSGLTFTRTAGSNVVRVNGGAALTRYIWANELVGAIVDMGGGIYRRIARHTEGLWSSASGKHVELVLEGVDGTEPTSGSGLAIWSTRGTLVIHGLATLYRRWRLRIPAGTTADAFYQIGAFACGPIAAFGQQYSWGWTDVTEPNATRSQSADLVSRVRRRGPARRTWTWAWTQLISQRRLRNATPTPDYLGVAASSEGIANQQDVPYLLQGVLEYCRSGEVPLVALKSISATSGTMTTDRTLFMLGRLESSIGIENELGDETAGEAARISPIALVELP